MVWLLNIPPPNVLFFWGGGISCDLTGVREVMCFFVGTIQWICFTSLQYEMPTNDSVRMLTL